MSILMLLREAFCTLQRLAVVLFLRTQIYDPFESSEVCQPIFRPALYSNFVGSPAAGSSGYCYQSLGICAGRPVNYCEDLANPAG